MRVYMLRRYNERMKEARTLLGGKCVRCSETNGLQFDHIDPKTKSFTIGQMWSVSKELFDIEIRKCQLLCQRCHEEKTLVDKGQKSAKNTHGTLSSMRYCKCELCKKVKSDYNKLPHVANRRNYGKRLKRQQKKISGL